MDSEQNTQAQESAETKTVTVTATFQVPEDTNQNEFKNWVKSCPFSAEGGQTVSWPTRAGEDSAPADTNIGETHGDASGEGAASIESQTENSETEAQAA